MTSKVGFIGEVRTGGRGTGTLSKGSLGEGAAGGLLREWYVRCLGGDACWNERGMLAASGWFVVDTGHVSA